MYSILLQHLYLCYSSCVQLTMGFLYGQCERLFITGLTNILYQTNILPQIFEWLSLTWLCASVCSGAWSFLENRYFTR